MKASNTAAIIVVSLITFSGLSLILLNGKSDAPKSESSISNTDTTTDKSALFTTEQVAAHSTKSDCWTVIEGSVYDITSYVPRHPGGDEILLACGTDSTTLFMQRETTSGQSVGSGTPHSGSAQSRLSSLKIGTLTK